MCDALNDLDIGQLAHVSVNEELAPGENFIREDDPADSFFNVTSGTVRLFKSLPDGRRQITGFATVGHFLGLAVSTSCTVQPEPISGQLRAVGFASAEHLLGLATTTSYAFSAEAIDNVGVCRFSRSRLRLLLNDFPVLEHRMVQIASAELAAAQEQMLLLGRKTAHERLASFLMTLASAALPPCSSPRTHLHLPMARSDIADYLGLTIETVSRTFTRLKTERFIELASASEIRILAPDALQALARGDG